MPDRVCSGTERVIIFAFRKSALGVNFMATQTTNIQGSGYGNPYIDSLIWGCKWTGGTVTYTFGQDGYAIDGQPTLAYTDAERAMFREILGTYSSVCNITFKEVQFAINTSSVNMVEWKVASIGGTPDYIILGWHDVPDGTYIQNWGVFSTGGDYWSTSRGSVGYSTVIHELGHAVGLAHPHDGGDRLDATVFPGVVAPFDSYGTYDMNQGIWTVMSYNRGWATEMPLSSFFYGDVITPMALDIAALQKIYGANTKYMTGNDTYLLPDVNDTGTGWACIWDAKGNDTISANNSESNCYININSAPLVGANAGGYVSRVEGIYGGFTIANGVTIENAIGGLGNDLLIGNSTANILRGGDGNDTLFGGLGADVLFGGEGEDIFVFNSQLDKKSNVDVIKDFSVGEDLMVLDKAIFSAFDSTGVVPSDNFIVGKKALGVNDYLLFDSSKGALYYDADGFGKGAAIQFATVDLVGLSGLVAHENFVIV